MAGQTRSPTITMAYLIKYGGMTADEAIDFVMEKRIKIENEMYQKRLRAFEKYLEKRKK